VSGALPGPAWLFCPGDRPDRYQKALDRADLVIIDLEDAVSPAGKPAARAALMGQPLDPGRVVVRVNAASSGEQAADLAALAQTDYRTVMLAKAEQPAELAALSQWAVVALIETPLGVLNAAGLAADPGVCGLMWGAEDLVAAMGGRSSRRPDGRYRDVARQARSTVLLAAHAHRRMAVDSVYLELADRHGLAVEAADAAASGFHHKACVHPDQAEVVRAAFAPSAELVAWAPRVLPAGPAAGGVSSVDGQMVDAPLRRQAEQILAAARRFSAGAAAGS
jgi:citrate lyase subunit beta/citryl-CoA lyase